MIVKLVVGYTKYHGWINEILIYVGGIIIYVVYGWMACGTLTVSECVGFSPKNLILLSLTFSYTMQLKQVLI